MTSKCTRTAYFAVLSLFLAASCQDPAVPETLEPEITFKEDTLDIPATGGGARIGYTLTGEAEEAVIDISGYPEWISGFSTEEDGYICFSIDANNAETPREGTVSACITGVEQTFSFCVRQEGADIASFSFPLEDLTESSFTYSVIPVDKELTYMTMLIEKSYFDGFADDEAFFQDDLEYFKKAAEAMGMTLEQFLQKNLRRGDTRGLAGKRLVPETDYYTYAYGMNTAGERLTDIEKALVRTLPIEMSDLTFDITCNIDGAIAEITVVPTDQTHRYILDVLKLSQTDFDKLEENYQDYINRTIEANEMVGTPADVVIEQITVAGTQTLSPELDSNTEYVTVAIGVNPRGIVVTEAFTKTFATGEAGVSDNVITLTLGTPHARSAGFEVTTTNNDQYVFGIDVADKWKDMTDEEILAELTGGSYNLQNLKFRGDRSGKFEDLKPQTEYLVFAFGYAGGSATTALTREFFTTTAPEEARGTFSLLCDKYYDGTEIAALYPDKYADAAGFAVLPVTVSATGSIERYFYYIIGGDYTDPQYLSDEEAYEMLLNGGLGTEAADFFIKYDEVLTLIGFGADTDSNYTPVFRKRISLRRDGTSPADEFVPKAKAINTIASDTITER